ncbi:hypothetical protein HPT25_19835 [Bacillus sp. BRMEA1]|uniref:hypothetical protein n=1 Tax=Neobacillus endophyticus TaxID=2738405 RepID=UPI0015654AF2|nr:hypothetical protein [Neobacillus endophyticus]NRD79616.1 hypothetical protein [Neobacillus endophyticus]
MKKKIIFALIIVVVISLTALSGGYAFEARQKLITISKTEADITGDGKKEILQLKGIPYQDHAGYLKNIYLDIKESNGKYLKLPFESGSKTALQLADLNHDGMKDVFVTVFTGGSEGTTINYLYTLKNFIQTDLTVPAPLKLNSKYMNGYQAEIRILDTGKTYHFDLKDRSAYYKQLGLYYNGRLNEPTELTVNSFSSLKPISLGGGKTGLTGIQRVSGIANTDTIAYVQSTWDLINHHWKLIKTDVWSPGSESQSPSP